MTKLFYKMDFTGLRSDTDLISIGVVSEDGNMFYAEFDDYDRKKVTDYVRTNVINNLMLEEYTAPYSKKLGAAYFVKGDTDYIRAHLLTWLRNFKHVEFYGDVISYSAMLLNELLGGALNLPENVSYIIFDIATIMRMFHVDPNINRENFIDKPINDKIGTSLHGAKVIAACYDKLYRNRFNYSLSL